MKSLSYSPKKITVINPNRYSAPCRAKEGRVLFALSILLLLVGVLPASAQEFSIFGLTNIWKYSTVCHDGDNWQTPGFDDSTWGSGPGGFTGGETSATLL